MIADNKAAAEIAKGKRFRVSWIQLRSQIPPMMVEIVVCSEVRCFGGIWHGWMYNEQFPANALGYIPLLLCEQIE